MIFVIRVITYTVGVLVFRFYKSLFGITVGERIGLIIMFAGVAMALASCLILAWDYLP